MQFFSQTVSLVLLIILFVLFALVFFSSELHRGWRTLVPVKKTKYRSTCLYCGGFYEGVEREYKVPYDNTVFKVVIVDKITKGCPCNGEDDFVPLKNGLVKVNKDAENNQDS